MLKHYGLDAAEVEHLKAANLTDEEINNLNKQRVQEQMEDESGNDDYLAPSELAVKISKLLPGVHPAFIGYLISTGKVLPNNDLDKVIGSYIELVNHKGGFSNLNSALKNVFTGVDVGGDTGVSNPDDYDYSKENIDTLSQLALDLLNKGTKEDDAESDKAAGLVSALELSQDIINNYLGN